MEQDKNHKRDKAPHILHKSARKSAPGYGAEDYSAEEDDFAQEDETSPPMDSPTEKEQRQELFGNLHNALWTPSPEREYGRGTFATCGAVKYSEGFTLKSFHVEGAGELQLPLSAEDTFKLCSVCEPALFGKDSATSIDTSVQHCWQVDGSRVTFPGAASFLSNVIQPLAMKAISALGLDGTGAQLEVHLNKLFLYEEGAHFTFHRDMEKEKNIFATLILQLPTEEGYIGGKLVVKHFNSKKKFDCHLVGSIGFCYTAFFADCLHELRKIESGHQLCLAFDLVNLGDSPLDLPHRKFISRKVGEVEAALQPWFKEAIERKENTFGWKFAIPLHGNYTKENLSFASLEGDDAIAAEVLKECRDKDKENWLDLYLFLVTKYELGYATPIRGGYYSRCNDPAHHKIHETIETETKIKNWVGVDDKPALVPFKNLNVDMKEEIVGPGPFDGKPDLAHYDNDGEHPTMSRWYERAMLVVWPKNLSITVACTTGISTTLDFLESSLEICDPRFSDGLHQVVCYWEKNALQAWEGDGEEAVIPRLINLCRRTCALEDFIHILRFLTKPVEYQPYDFRNNRPSLERSTFKIGIRDNAVVEEIASAIQILGWEILSSVVMDLVKELAMTQGESLVQLANHLTFMGIKDVGAIVAESTFEVFRLRIAELEEHEMPQFTWCQTQANIPDHPDVENFLKGPEEKYTIKRFSSVSKARAFVRSLAFKNGVADDYSAVVKAEGQGYGAYCVIQKTRGLFEVALELWRKEQAEIHCLKQKLEELKSIAVTGGFGQHTNKRQRLDLDM